MQEGRNASFIKDIGFYPQKGGNSSIIDTVKILCYE